MKGNQNNITETPLYKLLIKKLWLILTVVMNAMSLINIGHDLKLVSIRWIEFFRSSLEFIEKLAAFLIYPLTFILNLFSFDIPSVVKNTIFFIFLINMGLTRHLNLLKSEQKELDTKQAIYQSSFLSIFRYVSSCLGLIGYFFVLLILVYFFGDQVVYWFIVIYFIYFTITLINFQGKEYEVLYKDFRNSVFLYMMSMFVVIGAMCLINYFVRTF